MRWLLKGIGDDSCFNGFIDPILGIRFTPRGWDQSLDTAFFVGMLIAVGGVTGDTHDFASLGDIAQFAGQIEQADLVPDDGLVEIVHEVSPLGAYAPGLIKIRTLIKTGNLTCWQGPLSDQV